MTGHTGLDPDKVRAAASVLSQQAVRLETVSDSVRTALGLADLTSPIIHRLDARAEQFRSIAVELRKRADEVENLDLGMGGYAATILQSATLRGLDSFDTIWELDRRIADWDGSDNDPILDDLIRRRANLLDERAKLAQDQWAQEDAAVQADIDASTDRVNRATETVQSLLHIDDQKWWTPQNDGKAEISIEDVIEIHRIVGSLDEFEFADVYNRLSVEEQERLRRALNEGLGTDGDQPWTHAVSWPGRFVYDGAIETAEGTIAVGQAAYDSAMEDTIFGSDDGRADPAEIGLHFGPLHDEALIVGAMVDEAGEHNLPFISNSVRCFEGDNGACAWLGVEAVLHVGAGIVVGQAGSWIRVRLADGTERLVKANDEVIEELGEAAATGRKVEIPPDRQLYRGDNRPYSPEGSAPGRRKSYVDPETGDLNPANPNGRSEIHHHVREAEPNKSDSPFSSFSDDLGVSRGYGDQVIVIDRVRLEADIASGHIEGVRVIAPSDVDAFLVDRLEQAQRRYNNNPSSRNETRLRRAEQDVDNAARDAEFLVQGVVPSEYIQVID